MKTRHADLTIRIALATIVFAPIAIAATCWIHPLAGAFVAVAALRPFLNLE